MPGTFPVISYPHLTVVCSLWFAQCQHIFVVAHAQAGQNPELRTIFYRLARLLRAAVTPVFVFDGPARPPIKHGKKVLTKPHWLTPKMQELIVAFRFHWIVVSHFPQAYGCCKVHHHGTGPRRSRSRIGAS